MLDYLIKGGTVVDGTGAAPRTADVGIRDGRIVEVGTVTDDATTVLDADGLLVTPGFIDPHTHYDAELHWDGWATPSSQHGVTSVIVGNCGFTLAPLKPEDALYTQRMMARRRGDADRVAPTGTVVGVAHLRRVPRPSRRPGRGQRRVPRRSLRAPALGARRRSGGARVHRRRARRDRRAARRVARRGWARPVAVAFVHAHRRRRAPGPEPARVRGRGARAV